MVPGGCGQEKGRSRREADRVRLVASYGVDLLSRRDAAKLLGISERSLGRQREHLQALGLVVKHGGRWMYQRKGLEAGYLSVAGLQAANAENFGRLQQVAAGDAPHLLEAPSIDEEDGEIPEPGKIPPWAESKASREYWLSEKERLSVERTKGNLIDRDIVAARDFEVGRQARDAFLRLDVQLPPILAGKERPEQVIIIRQRINEILEVLAENLQKTFDDMEHKASRLG